VVQGRGVLVASGRVCCSAITTCRVDIMCACVFLLILLRHRRRREHEESTGDCQDNSKETVPVRTPRRTWPCSSATLMFRILSVTVATDTRRSRGRREACECGTQSTKRLWQRVYAFQRVNRERTFVRLRRRHSRGVGAGLQLPHNQQGSTAAGATPPLARSHWSLEVPSLREASAYVTPDTVARPRMRSSEAGERARRECVRAVAKAWDCVHRCAWRV
jgi:hypothetical protein